MKKPNKQKKSKNVELKKEKEISQNAINNLIKEDALKEEVLTASRWAIGLLLGLIFIGLVAGIELKTREDGLGKRVYDVFENCFENNLLTRFTGETIAISPPLIVSKDQIKTIFSTIRSAILEVK